MNSNLVLKINQKANSVAYSPDGRFIASCSDEESVKVWSAESGACVATLMGHSMGVNSVAYSHDGRRIASGSRDKLVKVWDSESGECVATLMGHYGIVMSVAFSPDDTHILSFSNDKCAKVWATESGSCILTLTDVKSVAFSPDGNSIISCSNEITVQRINQNISGGKKNIIKNKKEKSKKLIDAYKKSDLVKIAKMNDVSLKMRNDKTKTKLQLFNSLKRKKLI